MSVQKLRIIAFTKKGFLLGKSLAEKKICPETLLYRKGDSDMLPSGGILIAGSLKEWCRESFAEADAILFIGAAGIAVRTIAPFVQSKLSDPAVLVMDELGNHVISLLSGHLGGGNALTEQIAAAIGADPVITTASDVNGKLAIDVWAKKNGLCISDMKAAKKVAGKIVAGETVSFHCRGRIRGLVPAELQLCAEKSGKTEAADSRTDAAHGMCGTDAAHGACGPDVAVSVYEDWPDETLRLIPRAVILGMGCKKGKSFEEILAHAELVLRENHVARESVEAIASIDLKAEEPGLLELARQWQVPFYTYPAEVLRQVPGDYPASAFVQQTTGVDNVCERAAMAALTQEQQKTARFICRKTAEHGVTAALLIWEWEVSFE